MFRDKERFGSRGDNIYKSSNDTFYKPLKWESAVIFTCSWSDWFIGKPEWRRDAYAVMEQTKKKHTYLVLTKRPELMTEADMDALYSIGAWVGVSVESPMYLDRVRTLINCYPGSKFVSVEPLLLPITETDFRDMDNGFEQIDQWIIGGESGNQEGRYKVKEMELDDLVRTIDDIHYCYPQAHIHVKQLGTSIARNLGLKSRAGSDPQEWPVSVTRWNSEPVWLD
jgi:protein gp37